MGDPQQPVDSSSPSEGCRNRWCQLMALIRQLSMAQVTKLLLILAENSSVMEMEVTGLSGQVRNLLELYQSMHVHSGLSYIKVISAPAATQHNSSTWITLLLLHQTQTAVV
jgi:hypothetical protein